MSPFEIIKELCKNERTKPNKPALILCLCRLYSKNSDQKNYFQLTSKLEDEYANAYKALSPNSLGSPIEYPFYHLHNNGFWTLNVKPDMQDELDYIIEEKKGRFTKNRLQKVFSYACLSEEFDTLFRNDLERTHIETTIMKIFTKDIDSVVLPNQLKPDSDLTTLDTQGFPFKKHWLAVALQEVPKDSSIFSASRLSYFRKVFLAGYNQKSSIRNWLVNSDLLEVTRTNSSLTSFGRLVAKHDNSPNMLLTWWLIHLHLCSNQAFPYSGFFELFDISDNWLSIGEATQALYKLQEEISLNLAKKTVDTYFDGIDKSFRPGQMLYMIGLLERRSVRVGGATKVLMRRRKVNPTNELIVYAIFLLHKRHFTGESTVFLNQLLRKGLSRILGMQDSDLRERLKEMRNDPDIASFMNYTHKLDIDSIEFLKHGSAVLKQLREYMYEKGDVKWS